MAKTIDPNAVAELEDAQAEVEESQNKPKRFQSKRGAKLLGKKATGAARVMSDRISNSNRITNLYKERVTDDDSGETNWYLWYTTEKSETHGKEEIVKWNPRTEEEMTIGHDFTIPFSEKKVKELMQKCFGTTSLYLKDGETTYIVKPHDVDKLFLADYYPGLTPMAKQ